jgi:Domain of unknown function (DUF4349)/Putative zinc-finger
MKNDMHPVEAEELMAYVDGELPVERAAAAATHLQECRECQIVAAELKSVSESLATWEIEAKEPSITSELAAALDARESQSDAAVSGEPSAWAILVRFPRLSPFAGGALVGGMAALLVTFLLIIPATLSHRSPPSTPLAARSQAQNMAAAVPGQGSGGDRDRLAPPTPSFNDSQRLMLAQRSAQADLSSNLETAATSPVTAAVKVSGNTTPAVGPMILRTAQITLVAQNLDKARAAMDQVVKRYSGYVGDLSISAPTDSARRLTANLRLPAAQLDAALAELKTLGRVESESQSGQDVTAQYVDLEARLSNARKTEQRLIDLLGQRTGKLSDVLEVETELSRIREEIERMEGERRLLSKQVEYATLSATITEEFKAPAQALPSSLGTQFRNAAVDGYQSVVNFVIGVALFLVSDGPMLLLWVAILFFPARYAWRRLRNREAPPSPK